MGTETENVLYAAIKANDLDKVEKILEDGASVTDEDQDGLTPIDFALEHAHRLTINVLLRYYELSDTELPSERDIRHLFISLEWGIFPFFGRWLKRGFSFNIQNSKGEWALQHATTYNCDPRIVDWIMSFLEEGGATPKVKDKKGRTPIHVAVETCGDDLQASRVVKSIIYQLVRAGGDVNAKDINGKTPLHVAFVNGSLNCVFHLLRFGADINVKDEDGLTVIDYILEHLTEEGWLDMPFPRELLPVEEELFKVSVILFYHIFRGNAVKLSASEQVNSSIGDLMNWFNSAGKVHLSKLIVDEEYHEYGLCKDEMQDFLKKCSEEQKKLERKNLDGFTSLQSFLLKTRYSAAQFVKKPVVREYFESGEFKTEFPIYWHILELEYRQGVARSILLPFARIALKKLNLRLPEVCLDCVIDKFTNDDLIDFIEKMFPVNYQFEDQCSLSALLQDRLRFEGRIAYP